MKRLLSILLSVTMLFVGVFSLPLSAEATALHIDSSILAGETLDIAFDVNGLTLDERQAVIKFVPTASDIYEFTVSDATELNDNQFYRAIIITNENGMSGNYDKLPSSGILYNNDKETINKKLADSTPKSNLSVAAELRKGKTYFFLMEGGHDVTKGEYDLSFTGKLTLKRGHTCTYHKKTKLAGTETDGGVYNYCFTCSKQVMLERYPAAYRIALSKSSYIYDGKTKKPTVTMYDKKGNKIPKSYYTVSYTNNSGTASDGKFSSVGYYYATARFDKKYYKSYCNRIGFYQINPKSTTLSSVASRSKGFLVKWKKQSVETTGYEIKYSTTSDFKNAEYVKVSGSAKTSKTIRGLKAKKKYYVKLRTYKKLGNDSYVYSSWSKAKTVTTKK